MTWTKLTASNRDNNTKTLWWLIPFINQPGKLWLYIPGFSRQIGNRLIVEIGNRRTGKFPDFIASKSIEITEYGSYHQFELPPVDTPVLGCRFEQIPPNGVIPEVYLLMPFDNERIEALEDSQIPVRSSAPATADRASVPRFFLQSTGELYTLSGDKYFGELKEESLVFETVSATDWDTPDNNVPGKQALPLNRKWELPIVSSQQVSRFRISGFGQDLANVRLRIKGQEGHFTKFRGNNGIQSAITDGAYVTNDWENMENPGGGDQAIDYSKFTSIEFGLVSDTAGQKAKITITYRNFL